MNLFRTQCGLAERIQAGSPQDGRRGNDSCGSRGGSRFLGPCCSWWNESVRSSLLAPRPSLIESLRSPRVLYVRPAFAAAGGGMLTHFRADCSCLPEPHWRDHVG